MKHDVCPKIFLCIRCLLVAAALLIAGAAAAHETLHEVVRGRAIAVKAYFADGELLAYTSYEVYSPADEKIPYQKGRTDRSGWLAFVPNTKGTWRVRVIDSTGHGIDVGVEAGDPEHDAGAATADAGAVSSWAFVVRPLVGLAAIGAVFLALTLLHRRKGAA